MLTAVTIKGLRGIREGELRDLTPLAVLVGPNGAGKSTILEAIQICASQQPAVGTEGVLLRREGDVFAIEWLFWKMGRTGSIEVRVDASEGAYRIVKVFLDSGSKIRLLVNQKSASGSGEFPVGDLSISRPGNYSVSAYGPTFSDVSDLRFVSPSLRETPPLNELFSELVRQGLRAESLSLLGKLIPGLEQLEILTEKGKPVLYLDFPDRAVPATLAGDGIHLLLRLGFQLATVPGGVALLEEPETHLHPGAIRQCARAIVAAVRRQVQVILTTHSLELIDSLLAELTIPADKDLLSVYRLRLDNGILQSSRFDGADVALARGDIVDDLR